MTNEAMQTELYEVVLDGFLPWTACLAWLTIPLLVVWALFTVGRWLLVKVEQRDPTPVVVACVIQFALFLLLSTNADLRHTFWLVDGAAPESSLLFLAVAQMLQGAIASALAGIACTCLVCGVARRLPRLPLHTILPVLIALADTFLSGCWLLWMFTVMSASANM
jgi:hypothetical protein